MSAYLLCFPSVVKQSQCLVLRAVWTKASSVCKNQIHQSYVLGELGVGRGEVVGCHVHFLDLCKAPTMCESLGNSRIASVFSMINRVRIFFKEKKEVRQVWFMTWHLIKARVACLTFVMWSVGWVLHVDASLCCHLGMTVFLPWEEPGRWHLAVAD